MNKNEILSFVSRILHEECGVKVADIHGSLNLYSDLNLESMGLLTLATQIENHFKIILEESFEQPPQTIDDIINLISRQLSK